jgi:2-dehydro-3-deoxyphosphogluconate aldolase / (4S)-4-hydroxy-2-oxoglutarate aldolase
LLEKAGKLKQFQPSGMSVMQSAILRLKHILSLSPVIPVLTLDNPDTAVPAVEAITRGGLKVVEIKLRTPVSVEALRRIASALPDVILGAGSIINKEQYLEAIKSGAQFCVSPGFTPDLLETAAAGDIPLLPGSSTAAEAMFLLDAGFSCQKFYPAEAAGGIAYLKELRASLPQILFCPAGGIHADNAASYLALSNVACVSGDWITPKDSLAAKDWAGIEALAQQASSLSELSQF